MTKLILDCCNNHMGDIEIIKEMIRVGSKSADYIKFQLYDSSKLSPDYPQYVDNYLHYQKCEINKDKLALIFDWCRDYKVKPMFTIFNESRIEYLMDYISQNFAIKIASPDASKIEYISKIRSNLPDKPMVISCGMISPEDEINVRKSILDGVFLYCISKYPTRYRDIDFELMKKYDGFSDHTIGLQVPRDVSIKFPGIEWYEKHFTLARTLPTRDRLVSVEPKELGSMYWYLKSRDINTQYYRRFSQE